MRDQRVISYDVHRSEKKIGTVDYSRFMEGRLRYSLVLREVPWNLAKMFLVWGRISVESSVTRSQNRDYVSIERNSVLKLTSSEKLRSRVKLLNCEMLFIVCIYGPRLLCYVFGFFLTNVPPSMLTAFTSSAGLFAPDIDASIFSVSLPDGIKSNPHFSFISSGIMAAID